MKQEMIFFLIFMGLANLWVIIGGIRYVRGKITEKVIETIYLTGFTFLIVFGIIPVKVGLDIPILKHIVLTLIISVVVWVMANGLLKLRGKN